MLAAAGVAGLAPPPADLAAAGVYVGCMYTEYLDSVLAPEVGRREGEERGRRACARPTAFPPSPQSLADAAPAAVTGHGLAFLVGRVAYTFNMTGPAAAVDTACSSSLVALASAHAGVAARTPPSALAGGVNAMLNPVTTARICLLGALAPAGRCAALDVGADGYGRSEGFGVVLVVPGEVFGAVAILASALVGQGGAAAALTAPSGPAQRALVGRALADGRVSPAAVALASLHGTGTPLGDPIEVAALSGALGAAAAPRSLLAVKAALGHTEGAAGVTGAVVASLALAGREAAPVARLASVNPHVEAALGGWGGGGAAGARARGPRAALAGPGAAAGASSFGMSGVNAHIVMLAGDAGGPAPASLPWRRARAWPAPQRTSLLLSGGAGGGAVTLAMPSMSTTPALAYVRQHRVGGRALLPAAALFDAALVAGRSLAWESTQLAAPAGRVLLLGAAIAVPCVADGGVGATTVAVDAAGAATLATGAVVHMTARLGRCTPKKAPARRRRALSGARPPALVPQAAVAVLAAPALTARGAHCVHPASGDAAILLSLALGGEGVVVR